MLESLFEHHDSVMNNDGVMRNVMNNDENKTTMAFQRMKKIEMAQ
jgi:uncharacterized protein YdcH (DUF465 family)